MRVNEIFYSIQGEGYYTGHAATFVRFSGCNLKCPFCDTEHLKYNNFSEEEIVDFVKKYPSKLVVITGGEPSLQLTHSLVEKLHNAGKYVSVETNGTKELPKNVDWITVSPKAAYVKNNADVVLRKANEVKVVFDNKNKISDYNIEAEHYYIQPCDTGDLEQNYKNVKGCINFIKDNPKWKLSLQTQKILNVQ